MHANPDNSVQQPRLWIMSEERLKPNTLRLLLELSEERVFGSVAAISTPVCTPRYESDGRFSGSYEVTGYSHPQVAEVVVEIVEGYSSFVDCMIYYQAEAPIPTDPPLLAVEITKTTDLESRNTAVGQRAIKFLTVEAHYPGANVGLVMLYESPFASTAKPASATNVFNHRLLSTLGVRVVGRDLPLASTQPFTHWSEIIEAKNAMPLPSNGQAIRFGVGEHGLTLSGRLVSRGGLRHDPNKGTLALIVAAMRALGCDDAVTVTHHGLEQAMLGGHDKFVRFCNAQNVALAGLDLPASLPTQDYWRRPQAGEKRASLLLHAAADLLPHASTVFENHAGCEKGYLFDREGGVWPVPKSMRIPDLVLYDRERDELLMVEAEATGNAHKGVLQLEGFDDFVEMLGDVGYESECARTVIVCGGSTDADYHETVSMQLADDGTVRLFNPTAIVAEAFAFAA
jgi:hypothetical protein